MDVLQRRTLRTSFADSGSLACETALMLLEDYERLLGATETLVRALLVNTDPAAGLILAERELRAAGQLPDVPPKPARKSSARLTTDYHVMGTDGSLYNPGPLPSREGAFGSLAGAPPGHYVVRRRTQDRRGGGYSVQDSPVAEVAILRRYDGKGTV